MTDSVWKRDEIESPCIKVCVVHPEARICTGCLRSIDEITRWSKMSAEERRAIMAALPDRAGELKKRRGGRAARLRDRV
jgi:Predicted Fe-S protein